MEKLGLIYGLYDAQDPTQRIRYVGQTVNDPRRRLSQHRNEARHPACYLAVHRWGAKIGPERVSMRFLEENIAADDLNERETYWIATLRTFKDWGEGGLNLTSDGKGSEITDKSRKSQRDAVRLKQDERSDLQLLRSRPNSSPKEVVDEIRRRYRDEDLVVQDLAEEFQLDRHRIKRILSNGVWHDPEYEVPTSWRKRSRASRQARGIGSRATGLNWDKVSQIRKEWINGEKTCLDLGKEFGVHHTSIWHVVSNRTWVDSNYEPPRGRSMPTSVRESISRTLSGRPKPEGFGKRGSDNYAAKMTVEQVRDIINRLHLGEKGIDLALEYGVTPSAISCIKRGKSWTDIPRPGNLENK